MSPVPGGVAKHLRGLRHVGVVTADSEAVIARFKAIFGLRDEDIQAVATPDTRFVFFRVGGQLYEVIEPTSERFKALLLKQPGVNHVCYNVDDLTAAVGAMAAAGVRVGHVTPDGIVETPSARMAYFNPDDTAGVLIEFVEPRS